MEYCSPTSVFFSFSFFFNISLSSSSFFPHLKQEKIIHGPSSPFSFLEMASRHRVYVCTTMWHYVGFKMSDVKYCILCLLLCQLPFENSSWVQETAAEKVCWLCKNPLFFHFHFLFHFHFSFDFHFSLDFHFLFDSHFLFYFHFSLTFTFYLTFIFYFSFTFLFKLILQLVCKKSSSSPLSLLCSNPPFTFLELVSMKCCALMLKLLFWPVCVRLWILVSKWKLYQLEWLINCVCRDEFF